MVLRVFFKTLYRAVIFLLKENADSSLSTQRSSQQGDRGTRRYNYCFTQCILSPSLFLPPSINTLSSLSSFLWFLLHLLGWCEVNQEVLKSLWSWESIFNKPTDQCENKTNWSLPEPGEPRHQLIKHGFTWVQRETTCRPPSMPLWCGFLRLEQK